MDQNYPAQNNQPQQQPPAQNQAQPPVPPQSPPVGDVPIDIPPPGSPIKKILLLVGTLIGILSIVALTFFYIVPKITGPKEPENVELVYWGVWDDEDVFKEIVTEFEKENPHINIKYELQEVSKLNDYVPRLQTRIDEGTGPDIFRFHNSMVRQLVTGSNIYLLSLPDDLVKKSGLSEEFYPVIQDEMKVGGAFYGIPQYIDTLVLFVNDDIFKDTGYDYPTEWGYFLDLSRSLTVVEGDGNTRKIVRPGAAMGVYDNIEHAEDIISLLMLQSGIDTENFTEAERVADIAGVLEYYTCFAKSTASCEPVWDNAQQNSKLAFATGKLPMYFGYGYDLFEILAVNPEMNIKVLPVPRLGDNRSTVASYWAEGISSKTSHAQEAYKFLEFLTSRENMQISFANQTKLYGFGGAYPRDDMANLLSSNNYLSSIVEQAPNAKPFYYYSNTFDGAKNQSLSKAIADAISSIINDGTTVETAATTLVQQTADIVGLTLPTPENEE